jgi:hypothetical protein
LSVILFNGGLLALFFGFWVSSDSECLLCWVFWLWCLICFLLLIVCLIYRAEIMWWGGFWWKNWMELGGFADYVFAAVLFTNNLKQLWVFQTLWQRVLGGKGEKDLLRTLQFTFVGLCLTLLYFAIWFCNLLPDLKCVLYWSEKCCLAVWCCVLS